MRYSLENLKKQGNLLEKLLNDNEPIALLRVYGYESHVGNAYYSNEKDRMDTEEEKKLLEIFDSLRKKLDKLNWNDNKIVCEIVVGNCWRIFVGFWDWNISIGGSVLPNLYPVKYKENIFGCIEYIYIRGDKK